jgi:import inner membrane translocase subunit TIM54
MDDASASTSGSVSEVATVAQHEERDWWKTTYRERESHEESVWIEPCIVDDRLTARMSQFELSAEEEARAKRIGAGKEKAITKYSPEQE